MKPRAEILTRSDYELTLKELQSQRVSQLLNLEVVESAIIGYKQIIAQMPEETPDDVRIDQETDKPV